MKKKRIIIFSSVAILTIGLFSINSPHVYASIFGGGGGQETVQFLNTYNEYLTYGNFFNVLLHQVGWGLIKILYLAVSAIELLIPETFTLLDFLESAGVNSLASAVINDLVVALMVLTLVFIGIKMIIGKEPPKFKNMLINILVSGVLVAGLPTLMSTMQDMSIKFYEGTQTSTNNSGTTSLAWSLVQDSTADLLYLSEVGFSTANSNNVKNNLTPQSLGKTNLTALLTPDLISEAEGEEIKHLKYKLEQNAQGEDIAVKIDSGTLGFFSSNFEEGYFRYDVSFLPIIIGLLALTVAYVFATFVLITTIIELAIKRVVGYFVFATDLENGQRTKMVVQDIGNGFMLIAFTGLSMMFYTQFLSFLSQQTPNIIIYMIAIVSATFTLIKGSSTIMRYFGVDVGLKEGFGQLAGAFALGRATKGGLGKLGSTIKDMADAGKDGLSTKQALQDRGENTSLIGAQSEKADISPVSKLKSSVNSAGKTAGYLKSRGIAGFTEDTVKGAGERMANKGRTISDSVNSISTSARDGFNEGTSIGESNKQKWNSRKMASVNEMESSGGSFEDNNVKRSINNSQLDQSQGSTASASQKQRLEQELNPVNTHTPKEEKVRVTEEREAINGQNASSIQNEVQAPANNKLNPGTDKSINHSEPQDVVQNTRLNPTTGQSAVGQQKVNQELKTTSSNNSPLRQGAGQDVQNVPNAIGTATRQTTVQDIQPASNSSQTVRNTTVQDVQTQSVSMPQQATQRISQELQYVGVSNAEQVKQRVIQEVEQHATGTPEMKQRVVQQLEKANVATPEQVTQNVQHVLSKARLPQETQQIVQKVVQDVQKSENGSAEVLKQKVVQELENASFGHKEPIKQVIMTEVDRAFTATPEQLTQNVKQVIETVETVQTTNNVTTTQTNKVGVSNPYGFDFGLRQEDRPKKTGKRFDIFK